MRRRVIACVFLFFLLLISLLSRDGSHLFERSPPSSPPSHQKPLSVNSSSFPSSIFTNKETYNIFLAPPFPPNSERHSLIFPQEGCTKAESSGHGSESLILHLFKQIEWKEKEDGFPFRFGKSKVVVVSSPKEADLILIQHSLKESFGKVKEKEIRKGLVQEFIQHLKKIPSRCGGCDFVMVFGSGGSLGYQEITSKENFPHLISIGVDEGKLSLKGQKSHIQRNFDDEGNNFPRFSISIPYPLSPCNLSSPLDKTSSSSSSSSPIYPIVSPLSPRPNFLFYYSHGKPQKKQKDFFRSSLAFSITSQAEQQHKETVVFVHHDEAKLPSMHDDYPLFLSNSTFCLCPKGITPASQRMMHVSLYGCIPVILSDEYVPPFSSYFPPFFVRVKEKEMGELLKRLEGIKEEELKMLKHNLHRHVGKWMWGGRANGNNFPFLLMLHEMFALGELNRRMVIESAPFPFSGTTKSRGASLKKELSNFYYSLLP